MSTHFRVLEWKNPSRLNPLLFWVSVFTLLFLFTRKETGHLTEARHLVGSTPQYVSKSKDKLILCVCYIYSWPLKQTCLDEENARGVLGYFLFITYHSGSPPFTGKSSHCNPGKTVLLSIVFTL